MPGMSHGSIRLWTPPSMNSQADVQQGQGNTYILRIAQMGLGSRGRTSYSSRNKLPYVPGDHLEKILTLNRKSRRRKTKIISPFLSENYIYTRIHAYLLWPISCPTFSHSQLTRYQYQPFPNHGTHNTSTLPPL